MKKNEIYKDSKATSKAIEATFADHENIIIDCEDKEGNLRICIVSSYQLKQKTTKPPIKKMTINDLAVIVIQGFAKQEEANAKQDEFNKKVEAFMDKQMETNEKQEKFNEWVYDAITGLKKDVKRIDGVLEKNKIK